MRKLLLDRNYPLEERMVFFIYITMIMSSAVVIVMNIVDGIPFGNNYKWFGFILFIALVAVFYWKSVNSRRIVRNISFILTLYVIFPLLFIFSGGLRTAAIPYMIILLLAVIYSFTGKMRLFLVITYIILAQLLMLLNIYVPEIFPIVSDRTMYFDWITNFPLILIIIAMLSMWISSEYKYEREKALKFSKEMEELSRNDTLTGIFNRRYLESRVTELEDAVGKVWLFIFDIDRFKQINDSKGHAEGDRILVKSAKIMTNVFNDMTSIRIGGDEFLIIGSAPVDEMNEKVRRFKKLLKWELNITISGGVVVYDGSLDRTLKLGDDLLYKAKQSGRNKVIIEE